MNAKTTGFALALASVLALTASRSEAYLVLGPDGNNYDVIPAGNGGFDVIGLSGQGTTVVRRSGSGYTVQSPNGTTFYDMGSGERDRVEGWSIEPETLNPTPLMGAPHW